MKHILKIVFVGFLFLFFQIDVTAQIEDHYHSFTGTMYVPIIVDHQEEMNFNDGRKIEKNIPDKKMTFQVNLNAKDMRVKKGVFSGIIVKNIGSVGDEVITYKGKASKNKQVLEYIEITQEKIIFRMSTRENVEKTTSLVARFENIPKSPYGGGYKFKYGVSKIVSVSYNEEYTIPRYGFVNSYTETFVKIDEEKIGEYYSGVSAAFKPGVLKLEKENHLTISGPDTICRELVGKDPHQKKDIILLANSDIPNGIFKWECDNEAILFMEFTEGNGSKILVRALVEYLPSPDSVEINVTQKIGGLEYTATHKLNLEGGWYYFWPDCFELREQGVLTNAEMEECLDDFEKSLVYLGVWDISELPDNVDPEPFLNKDSKCVSITDLEYQSEILQEHLLSASGVVDPDTKLDSFQLNWVWKLYDEDNNPFPDEEIGKPRDFVKVMPFMDKWLQMRDKNKQQP